MVSGWQNNENCWFMVFCNKSKWGSSIAKYSKPASDNIRKAKLIGDNRAIMTHCRWLIWHVSHRPYPFIISIFASLYNHFCFFKSALDSYLWFIIYGSSLRWSLRKFPIVAYTLVRTDQSESWLNEIGTIQSKPIIQRVLLKTRNLRSIPPQPPDKAVSSKMDLSKS